MKNRSLICKCLLSLIIILSGITISYAYINKNIIFSEEEDSSSVLKVDNEDDRNDKDQIAQKNPTYESINKSDDPGLKYINTFEQFNALATREDVNTYFVFGRDGCHYCESFKPILEEVATLYKIQIHYIDMAFLSSDDYQMLIGSQLNIPSKCSKTGEDTSLSKGFGTPLTLFVRGNKTYDCIRGYKNRDNLIDSLNDVGYINY